MRAHNAGVSHLALTDHDTTAGIDEARTAARSLGITLIPGAELSVSWQGQTLHVVGLGLNTESEALKRFLKATRTLREARAEAICGKLAKIGLEIDWRSIDTHSIGRGHIAQVLIERGWVRTHQQAFDHYLKRGRKGHVRAEWLSLETGVAAIRAAGGIAVLAHPGVYRMTHSKMRRLLAAFRDAGGEGIEVITGANGSPADQSAAERARQFDLFASMGSDFHHPDWPWRQLGRLKSLPDGVRPIWEAPQLEPYFQDAP